MSTEEAKANVGKMVFSHDTGPRPLPPSIGNPAHGPYKLLQITKAGLAILEGYDFRVGTSLLELAEDLQ